MNYHRVDIADTSLTLSQCKLTAVGLVRLVIPSALDKSTIFSSNSALVCDFRDCIKFPSPMTS